MTETALGGELAQLTAEYEILGELGRGGSAVVYRARDRSLGRDVAIKVVHPRPLSPDDDAVARLAREARTVAQLQHPNIVTVFAVKRLSGGGLALVMQLVPGRTLKAIVQQDGPVEPERCQRILRDVAEALAYAHARGVVHRDVKPENIFVDEDTGRALLSDFGIARSDEHESMTLTGTAIGTPFYMSPEQIDGGAIDGRSDLYSLGLVAWEMLTGRRPWDGESLYNVIFKQKHEELPPIEALRSGVPLRLQYIIDRMLQKKAAARWAGAEGLLAQLAHTVLPGDYGRWQAALRKRVEKYRAELKERERTAADAVAGGTSGGLIASTMRFVRVATGRFDTRRAEPSRADAQALSDTMAVSRGALDALPIATAPVLDAAAVPVAVERPVPAWRAPFRRPNALSTPARVRTEEPIVPPSWEVRPRRTGRRLVLGALAVGLVAAAVLGAMHPAWVREHASALGARLAVLDPRTPPTDARVSLVAAVTADPQTPAGAAADSPTAAALTGAAPTSIGTLPHSVLSLGARHTCAVTIDGAAHCWGANERGQLGDGTAQRQIAPVRVAAELTFASIAAGSSQSCGVTRTGDVYCWGNDASGQLGDATTVRRNAPVRVAGPGVYRSATSGDAHSCALTVEGMVHCWGANGHGQLGDGTTRAHTVPTPIGAVPARFVQVAAGAMHTCALTTEGVAYCWGANDRGQLGMAGGDQHLPTPVAGDTRFAMLSTGTQHTCGLSVDGSVWCWGGNARGQLGVGARTASDRSPQRVRLAVPAVAVASGGQHACALTASGDAFCWGANGAGQLGIGSQSDASLPTRVASAEPFGAIAAGATHTCGATTAGALLCWGNNVDGQLGDATQSVRAVPTRVAFADNASHADGPRPPASRTRR
ncbi:protein kinase [Gemmatirosa kalamazoonensis]|uniref:non-specific serine/threonine protein kinase n=1 Tax=Gemmatirosa kalamazoonensis TaxID=861299 RepID=W0RKJ5_9BACT|nr:protein kinase [Gemmatirosa kalamazoonensis]AHG91276.1 protein kinase [Gemmatirosa kalamazoonensis]